MFRSLSFFTIASLLLILNGCQDITHISLDKHNCVIQKGKSFSYCKGEPIAQKRKNFSTLFIQQKILKTPEGNFIGYENARTDLQYEFEPTIHRIIHVVFDTVQMVPVYGSSHLYAYQIKLPGGRWINLLAQQTTTQELQLIYGMSNRQLEKIIGQLEETVPHLPVHAATSKNIMHTLQSRWTMQKVHFYPLVVPYQFTPFL